jgi:hypothetical protein
VGQVAAGLVEWLEGAVYRPHCPLLAPTHMGDCSSIGTRGAAVARCCVALDGPPRRSGSRSPRRRGGPARSCVRQRQRGNEPKRLRDLLCAGARNPRSATSDPESWWINGNNDWRHTVKVQGTVTSASASRASAAVAGQFRVTPWPLPWSACICNCRHPDSRQERLQHSLTMANVDGAHEGGS